MSELTRNRDGCPLTDRYDAPQVDARIAEPEAENQRLREFSGRLLDESEVDAIGASEPGWLAKLRDEWDAAEDKP